MSASAWTPVIGLEVHIQLSTRHKLFSPAERRPNATEANTAIDPFSLGLPGALPVLNPDAVILGARIALALGCTVHRQSMWDRKHYFYPDLPKGFQITQQRHPLATNGHLTFTGDDGAERTVRIQRIHLEEDAGKSVHGSDGQTRVDFNRAGAPLVEVVTAPDLKHPADSRRLLKRLHAIVRSVGASTAHMEQGEFRCDANVSVRGRSSSPRVEIKNLNSFRFVEQALAYEVTRQRRALEIGTPLTTETRLWNASARQTRPMRAKESSADYRYLPEPDLPPIVLTEDWIRRVQADLPELPAEKSRRYQALGVGPLIADRLADDPELGELFDDAVAAGPEHAPGLATLMLGELARLRNEDASARTASNPTPITADTLVRLCALKAEGRISSTQQKSLLSKVWRDGGALSKHLVEQLSDPEALQAVVEEVLDDHADVVAKYRAGKRGVLGFLVGAVMKATEGRASPPVVRRLLEEQLETPP